MLNHCLWKSAPFGRARLTAWDRIRIVVADTRQRAVCAAGDGEGKAALTLPDHVGFVTVDELVHESVGSGHVGLKVVDRHVGAELLVEVRGAIRGTEVERIVRSSAAFVRTRRVIHDLPVNKVREHFEAERNATGQRGLQGS